MFCSDATWNADLRLPNFNAVSAQITASTQLLGKVTFTRGTCNLTGSNIPGAASTTTRIAEHVAFQNTIRIPYTPRIQPTETLQARLVDHLCWRPASRHMACLLSCRIDDVGTKRLLWDILLLTGVTNNPAAAAVSQLLGSNPFGALGGTCQQVATAGVPPLTPMWTCGLQVQGRCCIVQKYLWLPSSMAACWLRPPEGLNEGLPLCRRHVEAL